MALTSHLISTTRLFDMSNEKLVERYKNGDQEAGLELLTQLEPVLRRFAEMLYNNNYDLWDEYTREFAELFVGGSEDIRKQLQNVLSVVSYKMHVYDYEDVMQDLRTIALDVIRGYDRECGTFNNYFFTFFKYRLKQHVEKAYRYTPMSVSINTLMGYELQEDEKWDQLMVYQLPTAEKEFFGVKGDSWISGETCGEPFNHLTPEERRILKYYYVDGMTGPEIASRLGKHKSNVSRKLNDIEQRIERRCERRAEDEAIFVDYHVHDKTLQEIGRERDKSPSTIHRRIKAVEGG